MKTTKRITIASAAIATFALTACGDLDFEDMDFGQEESTSSTQPEDSEVVSRDDGSTDYSAEFTAEEARDALSQMERVEFYDDGQYDREGQYGRWANDPESGCAVNELILLRDLENVETADGDECDVVSGTLPDPYSGEDIEYPADIQIDHSSVPLKYAHVVGADELSQDERVELANDPSNLLAVNGSGNACRQDFGVVSRVTENTFENSEAAGCDYRSEDVLDTTEGDRVDVEMPWVLHDDSEFQCEFTQQFIYVLDKYDLNIVDYDAEATEDILATC